jgi:hypothetical protein
VSDHDVTVLTWQLVALSFYVLHVWSMDDLRAEWRLADRLFDIVKREMGRRHEVEKASLALVLSLRKYEKNFGDLFGEDSAQVDAYLALKDLLSPDANKE